MPLVLQKSLPFDPFSRPRLPGITPLGDEDWLIRDDAFAQQMAIRDSLIATRRQEVIQMDDRAWEAAQELLDEVLLEIGAAGHSRVMRRDGQEVAVDRSDPLGSLGRLVQEDFCLLEKSGDEHVLVGAVLCFPAGWTLSEKFLRPLTRIHAPVKSYDDGISRRVQRLFDGVQAGRPLLRCNALWYSDPTLFQPRKEAVDHPARKSEVTRFFRSERQVVRRLARTGAVVFSIHTFMLRAEDVPHPAGAADG
ncbi:MAG: DUF3445 domain-containing protein [Arenibacterium sp.]